MLARELVLALVGIGAFAQSSVSPPPPPAPPISCDPFLILFDPGSAKVPPRYVQTINNIVSVREQVRSHMEVAGHTDASGSIAFNLRLSRLRAEAVKAALVAQGVPERLIVTKGHGEKFPLAPEALSRRVSVCFY